MRWIALAAQEPGQAGVARTKCVAVVGTIARAATAESVGLLKELATEFVGGALWGYEIPELFFPGVLLATIFFGVMFQWPWIERRFTKDLAENKARNDVNKVSDVKLLQGDLAEAWREGETDFASVAMRFSLVDKTLERTTGRLVSGSDTPVEATEVWTFARQRGGNWELSAIQQTN
mgnify:CR=1 FL=1